MLPEWPIADLPVRFLRDGYAETEPDIVERTEMDAGHVKRRLRSYPLPGTITGLLYCGATQFNSLVEFYRETAQSGGQFTMPHPVSGDIVRTAFARLPVFQPAAAEGKGRVPLALHKFGLLPARAKPERAPLVWPPGMPQYFLRGDFKAQPPDNVLAADAEQGDFQSRLIGVAGPSPLSGSMVMSDAQYDDLCLFYRDVVRGVLPFSFPDPQGDGVITVHFSDPPGRRPFSRALWQVRLSLEKR
jgi:hypothetical protein